MSLRRRAKALTVCVPIAAGAFLLSVIPSYAAVSQGNVATARVWHTCVRQARLQDGIYNVDNDLFTGKRGPSCVTSSTGHDVTIDRNYRTQGAGVVAYPAVRIGAYYWTSGSGSGLPVPVARVRLMVELRNTGNASGLWIDDIDAWFAHSDATARQHGIREMVIVTRWHNWSGGGKPVRIGRRFWRVAEWLTGSRSYRWPLIRFVLRRPARRLTLHFGLFDRIALEHHWIGRHMVLASVADGSECSSGCRGLTDSLTSAGQRSEHPALLADYFSGPVTASAARSAPPSATYPTAASISGARNRSGPGPARRSAARRAQRRGGRRRQRRAQLNPPGRGQQLDRQHAGQPVYRAA